MDLLVTIPSYAPQGTLRPLWVAGAALVTSGVCAAGHYAITAVQWGPGILLSWRVFPTVLLILGAMLVGIRVLIAVRRRDRPEQARLTATRWVATWLCLHAVYYGLWLVSALVPLLL